MRSGASVPAYHKVASYELDPASRECSGLGKEKRRKRDLRLMTPAHLRSMLGRLNRRRLTGA